MSELVSTVLIVYNTLQHSSNTVDHWTPKIQMLIVSQFIDKVVCKRVVVLTKNY